MEKLLCKPMMLPMERWDSPLLKSKSGLLHKAKKGEHLVGAAYYQLYLVSDREIRKGDYYLSETKRGNVIFLCDEIGKQTDYVIGSPLDNEKYRDGRERIRCFKIEATTDKSLGLPPIPQSFVEEYVNKQGKIEKVYIVPPNGALTRNSEVVILPSKDTFSREEFIEGLEKFREECFYFGNETTGKEWFDKNY